MPNNPHKFIEFTILLLRKFDAYRLKLKEIKHIEDKKTLKKALFLRGFFDFLSMLHY